MQPFHAIRTAAVLLLGAAALSSAEAAKLKKVDTSFGYVRVAPLDVAAAIAEGEAAQAAAKQVLSLPDERLAIVDEGAGGRRWGSTSGGYVTYSWPFPNGAKRFSPHPATNVLRHEIGHDLLKRHLVPRSSDDEYGTDAPDWLDEMTAIAFEGEDQQADRRKAARAELAGGGLIPLDRLLTMSHPELRPIENATIASGFNTSPPTSDDTMRFYTTIMAFYDYLTFVTDDKAIVARLAAAFSRGENLNDRIATLLAPGRNPSIGEAEAGFQTWLRHDLRYEAR